MRRVFGLAAVAVLLVGAVRAEGSMFATEVESYTAGSNSSASFRNSSAALGEPSHVTSNGGEDVTVFNPPFGNTQIVTVGAGGELVVKFDQEVVDHPLSVDWGVDFMVFGNTLYTNVGGKAGAANGEPGRIAVSQDGVNFVDVGGVFADTGFPTMGYTDSTSATGKTGVTLSDFTKPVDPSFNAAGLTLSQIEAGYAGSGGGTGVDIASTGFSWIQYVKVYQGAGDGFSTEVDGFAIASVPEPGSLGLLGVGMIALGLRRRVETTESTEDTEDGRRK